MTHKKRTGKAKWAMKPEKIMAMRTGHGGSRGKNKNNLAKGLRNAMAKIFTTIPFVRRKQHLVKTG